jgi:hypothetical protein
MTNFVRDHVMCGRLAWSVPQRKSARNVNLSGDFRGGIYSNYCYGDKPGCRYYRQHHGLWCRVFYRKRKTVVVGDQYHARPCGSPAMAGGYNGPRPGNLGGEVTEKTLPLPVRWLPFEGQVAGWTRWLGWLGDVVGPRRRGIPAPFLEGFLPLLLRLRARVNRSIRVR